VPEGLEAEIWRVAASPLVGRTVSDVWVDERVAPVGLRDAVAGAEIAGVDRVGKVLVVEMQTPTGRTKLGLHFGMTGRLVVDGDAAIERLEYASGADRPSWDRLRLWTERDHRPADVPSLRLNDPRRLGRISLDADLTHLGPDALTLTSAELRRRLSGRRVAIKTALLDQSVVAGLGNLCVDEVLWTAGIAPHRPSDRLDAAEVTAIARACRRRLPVMLRRGGSTMGELTPELRRAAGDCPLDGTPLTRSKVGGRTTVWCPHHQH
jgi:formamidopyrimidine-DNA glycosylase